MTEAKDPLDDFLKNHGIKDTWVYFSWSNTAVHSLPEDLYFKLRTSRNRNIIKEEEQKKYRDIKVGIAGLSVGSAVAEAVSGTGGPKILKIADPDVVELTNLNRLKATMLDIGGKK